MKTQPVTDVEKVLQLIQKKIATLHKLSEEYPDIQRTNSMSAYALECLAQDIKEEFEL